MKVTALKNTEYKPYYQTYIDKAGSYNLIEGLAKSLNETLTFYRSIPKVKFDHAYAPEKWTIKEIIQHLIDTERVFTYRALCFARGETISLPGFDENEYASVSAASSRSYESLIIEYERLRHTTIDLFQSFTENMLTQTGTASGGQLSVRAIGFILIGHETHHKTVITERYL